MIGRNRRRRACRSRWRWYGSELRPSSSCILPGGGNARHPLCLGVRHRGHATGSADASRHRRSARMMLVVSRVDRHDQLLQFLQPFRQRRVPHAPGHGRRALASVDARPRRNLALDAVTDVDVLSTGAPCPPRLIPAGTLHGRRFPKASVTASVIVFRCRLPGNLELRIQLFGLSGAARWRAVAETAHGPECRHCAWSWKRPVPCPLRCGAADGPQGEPGGVRPGPFATAWLHLEDAPLPLSAHEAAWRQAIARRRLPTVCQFLVDASRRAGGSAAE